MPYEKSTLFPMHPSEDLVQIETNEEHLNLSKGGVQIESNEEPLHPSED